MNQDHPPPRVWLTHDRRYSTVAHHATREDAEQEAAREPGLIDVVEYVPAPIAAPVSESVASAHLKNGGST